MTSRYVAAVLVVAACGRLAYEGDAGNALAPSDASTAADAAFHCDPTLPFDFENPTPLTELNVGLSQRALSLTPDELTAVFVQDAQLDASQSGGLYLSTRTSISAPFATPTMISLQQPPPPYPQPPPLQSLQFIGTSITADGLAVFFPCVVDSEAGGTMCLVTRESTTAAFGPVVTTMGCPCTDTNTLSSPTCLCEAFVMGDGLRAYLVPDYRSGVFIAQHATLDASFSYGPEVLLPPSPARLAGMPVVTSDELTLFTWTMPPQSSNVAMATRATTSEPFGALTNIETLDAATSFYDLPTWASPDGCRLYFARATLSLDGSSDIYVASRAN